MTVREFKARLDAIGDNELCCGTFWLDDDFLRIDPALTRAEIASAMEIAEGTAACQPAQNPAPAAAERQGARLTARPPHRF